MPLLTCARECAWIAFALTIVYSPHLRSQSSQNMLRFSDRLTSTSTTPAEQSKDLAASRDSSDEPSTDGSSPLDRGYANLVELLGLHQTVRILETEYNCITGDSAKVKEGKDSKNGYSFLKKLLRVGKFPAIVP